LPDKRHAGRHVGGFVQMPDVMPTLLGLMGLKPPPRATGSNAWPLATGETRSLRDFVVQTYGWVGAIRTPEWNYSQVWNPEAKKVSYRPQLYNLQKDPEELTDVIDRHPDVAKRLAGLMREYVASGQGMTVGSFNGRPALDIGSTYISRPD